MATDNRIGNYSSGIGPGIEFAAGYPEATRIFCCNCLSQVSFGISLWQSPRMLTCDEAPIYLAAGPC